MLLSSCDFTDAPLTHLLTRLGTTQCESDWTQLGATPFNTAWNARAVLVISTGSS